MPDEPQLETAGPKEQAIMARADKAVRAVIGELVRETDDPSSVLSGALYAIAAGDVCWRDDGITLDDLIRDGTAIYAEYLRECFDRALGKMN